MQIGLITHRIYYKKYEEWRILRANSQNTSFEKQLHKVHIYQYCNLL